VARSEPTLGAASAVPDEAQVEHENGAEFQLEPPATPEPRAPADAVALIDSEFRFLDPPEPGAQAHVSVSVRNDSPLPTGPLRLTLSTRWLAGWRVLAADPPVLDDYPQPGNRRSFDFPGLDGESEGTLELQLVATDDLVDPPALHVSLQDGEEIGTAQPQTVAPRPDPGPARSLEIPRLKLRAAVVQTAWEPPAFVVGQLRGTANVSEGNTVLMGHLNGLGGDVFARLSELEPGDEVIAVSRGLAYHFIISEIMVLPGDDSIPLQPTGEPRLTLLTCTGDWDPAGLDYSHRLWVVAEPAELADATLRDGKPGPLTRQLGLAPALTILPPADLGPSPKETIAAAFEADDVQTGPLVELLSPGDGTLVDARVTVRGRLTDDADPTQPVWLAVRAEIEGSRWYLYGDPLATDADGAWSASLELGGAGGIRHTIVAAPVDAATGDQLRRHAHQRPGEPLSLLPDAFEQGARVTVQRR
jgi:LPXTG-site transpeptidase (sortase) family protein